MGIDIPPVNNPGEDGNGARLADDLYSRFGNP